MQGHIRRRDAGSWVRTDGRSVLPDGCRVNLQGLSWLVVGRDLPTARG